MSDGKRTKVKFVAEIDEFLQPNAEQEPTIIIITLDVNRRIDVNKVTIDT